MLLRGFTDDEALLAAFDLVNRSVIGPTTVNNIGLEVGYNAVESPAGLDSTTLETTINQRIEIPAAGVIQNLRDRRTPISSKERTALARFVAYQWLRVPDARYWREGLDDALFKLAILEHGPEMLEYVLAAIAQRGGVVRLRSGGELWPEPEDIAKVDWADFSSFTIEFMKEYSETEAIGSFTDQLATVILERYSMHTISFSTRVLMSSDNPVAFHPTESGATAPGTAHAASLAVSRSTALVLLSKEARGSLTDGESIVPNFLRSRAINAATCSRVARWIYRHPEDAIEDMLGADVFSRLRPAEPAELWNDSNIAVYETIAERHDWSGFGA
jgi:hypothetical protein